MTVIQHSYVPRPQFLDFHARVQRWAVNVAHRRCGKTVSMVNDAIARALYTKKENAKYAFIAPYYSQAKSICWDYLKQFSEGIADRVMESELSVRLVNNSTVRLFGADNPDSLRGQYLDGVTFDEFQLMPEFVFTSVVRPMLADRMGWATFSGTPSGPDNHLKKYYDRAVANPKEWFSCLLRASETNILSAEELKDALELMGEDDYLVEFECDFYAALRGAIYGRECRDIEATGRFTTQELFDDNFVVVPVLDIGSSDATAITFCQPIAGEMRVIDYWEADRASVDEVDMLLMEKHRELGYTYEDVWLPHDAKARTFASPKSTEQQFTDLGWSIRIVPSLSKQDGIQAARKTLKRTIVSTKATRLMECLRNYSRKYDPTTKAYSREPKHDQYSHGADSFRYSCLAIDEMYGGNLVPDAKRRATRSNVGTSQMKLDDLWETAPRRLGNERI